jgi:baculoviral IAP repeat-containing protein 6
MAENSSSNDNHSENIHNSASSRSGTRSSSDPWSSSSTPANAAPTTTTTKNVVIDLCGEDSPNTIICPVETIDAVAGAAVAGLEMGQNNHHRPAKRPRRCPDWKKQQQQPYKDDSIIDVDQENDDEKEEEEGIDLEDAAYRRVLGPLRMEFIDHWHTPHSLENHTNFRAAVGVIQHYSQGHNYHPASSTNSNMTNNTTTTSTRILYKELIEYQINLPISKISSVFVRAHGSRMDQLRVCITGPHGTPYSMGCFFFDLSLIDYPHQPPRVLFLTTHQKTVRFNPNLYECGKVCLSLLGTWHGPGWVPNQSTLLQVLVSIQGLILVENPYFNEPGFERDRGTPQGQKASEQYNARIRKFTLQYAIAEPLQQLVNSTTTTTTTTTTNFDTSTKNWQYPELTKVARQHFLKSSKRLEEQLQDWTTGNNHDPSLIVIANRIREHLAILQSQDESEKQFLLQQQQQQQDLEAKQKHRPPNPAETIVLLDDD